MIILGVWITAILAVENMVLNYYAYVFMWYTSAWVLTLISVWVGILIGYGIKGMMIGSKSDINDDYDF